MQESSDFVSPAVSVGGCRSAVPASRHAVGPDVAADGVAGDAEQPGGRPASRVPVVAPAGWPSSGRAVGAWVGGAACSRARASRRPRWAHPPPPGRQAPRGAAGVLLRSRARRRCARGPGAGPARSAPLSAPRRAAAPRARRSLPPGAGRRARRPAAPAPRVVNVDVQRLCPLNGSAKMSSRAGRCSVDDAAPWRPGGPPAST